jgi:hypothetical protein
MKFWAIGYRFQEEVYYNVVTDQDTFDMDEECLLPSKALAMQVIEEGLTDEYVPVEIEIERLDKHGMTWGRGPLEDWDQDY